MGTLDSSAMASVIMRSVSAVTMKSCFARSCRTKNADELLLSCCCCRTEEDDEGLVLAIVVEDELGGTCDALSISIAHGALSLHDTAVGCGRALVLFCSARNFDSTACSLLTAGFNTSATTAPEVLPPMPSVASSTMLSSRPR